MPNSAQLVSSWWIWAAAIWSRIGRRARRGRDGVVRGRDGLAGTADRQAARAQTGERLGTRDLVDEVEVDREDGGGARVLGDDVVGPDLLDDGARFGARARCGHGALGCGSVRLSAACAAGTRAYQPARREGPRAFAPMVP